MSVAKLTNKVGFAAQYLHELGEVRFENIFIDGTKIEANANRYTFAWKKVVNKDE
ncbi:MAG: hypothetical protein ACYDG2_16575 [Ruminiclostridium sp.]